MTRQRLSNDAIILQKYYNMIFWTVKNKQQAARIRRWKCAAPSPAESAPAAEWRLSATADRFSDLEFFFPTSSLPAIPKSPAILYCANAESAKKRTVYANLLYELGQFTISELEFNIVRYYFPYKKLSVERACDEK